MKYLVLTLIVLCSVLISHFPQVVSADGGPPIYWDSNYGMSFLNEHLQIAAINYENGNEKLAIAIKLDPLRNKSVAWIVPVPAKANDVKIDILKNFPEFEGVDLAAYADEKVDRIVTLPLMSSLTQIYPSIYVWLSSLYIGSPETGYGGTEVHAEVQKGGITSQVITADNAESLYDYLKSVNITVERGSLPILEEYIGENYSFVASWVSSVNESDYRTPSIFIEFPNDEIYYPMKPTSMYGDTKVPVLIYVVGFVQPKLYAEIENYTSIRYVEGSITYAGNDLSTFYNSTYISNYEFDEFVGGKGGKYEHVIQQRVNVNYTKIMIGFSPDMVWSAYYSYPSRTPPARNFIEDIYMGKPDNPPEMISAKLSKASLLDAMVSPLAIVIWILTTSVLSGAVTGRFVFRKAKKSAIIALSNCLTIIALAIATYVFFKPNEGNRTNFLVAFSLIYLVINFLFAIILRNMLLFII